MKRQLHFSFGEIGPLFPEESGFLLSSALYSEIKSRWPQFAPVNKTALIIETDDCGPVLKEIIAFVEAHGRKPYTKRHPSLANVPALAYTHYQVTGKRVFEPADYQHAEFFRFFPQQSMAKDFEVSDGGYYRIPQRAITGAKIGSLLGYRLHVCRDSIKRLMEFEGFTGLRFQHVEVSECRKPAESLWKLESDRHMPPVLDRLVNHMGETFDSSVHRDCWPDDDYEPFLLRFSEAAVRAMGDFDAALTQERYGIPLDHILIVSRRFRDWCERRKLKLQWYPVALE